MFPSANIVAFVNDGDFIEAATRAITGPSPAYLCISYDTDLLAIENIFGYCARYIEYAQNNPHVTVEIRTKSANIEALNKISPAPNVILAWTISPDPIISRYEHGTPRLSARLAAISKAHQRGWRVRLCIDPMIRVDSWQTHYGELISETFSQLTSNAIEDLSIGVFRMPSGYLRTMQENNPTSALVHYPYTVRNKSASYTPEQHQEMITTISEQLRPHLPQEKICPVPWQL
jgi:spore photoproduct lyase